MSLDILKRKMTLLEALADIEVAVKVLQAGDQSMNPIDRNYLSLECDLKPMDRSDDTYSVCRCGKIRHLFNSWQKNCLSDTCLALSDTYLTSVWSGRHLFSHQ